MDNTPLPNPFQSDNAKKIFNSFEKSNSAIDKNLTLTSKDRSIIANYLNTCLRIHFEGLGMLKSLKFINSIWGKYINDENLDINDPKTILQELSQERLSLIHI